MHTSRLKALPVNWHPGHAPCAKQNEPLVSEVTRNPTEAKLLLAERGINGWTGLHDYICMNRRKLRQQTVDDLLVLGQVAFAAIHLVESQPA